MQEANESYQDYRNSTLQNMTEKNTRPHLALHNKIERSTELLLIFFKGESKALNKENKN